MLLYHTSMQVRRPVLILQIKKQEYHSVSHSITGYRDYKRTSGFIFMINTSSSVDTSISGPKSATAPIVPVCFSISIIIIIYSFHTTFHGYVCFQNVCHELNGVFLLSVTLTGSKKTNRSSLPWSEQEVWRYFRILSWHFDYKIGFLQTNIAS